MIEVNTVNNKSKPIQFFNHNSQLVTCSQIHYVTNSIYDLLFHSFNDDFIRVFPFMNSLIKITIIIFELYRK